eukprot:7025713-Pyramimonas_sp.AAC.1
MCIARGMKGWWKHGFLSSILHTATVYASVFSLLPQDIDRKRVQKFFYKQLQLAIPTPLEHCPQSGLLQRLRAWRHGITPMHVEQLISSIKYVVKKSQAYIGVSILRIACRGICTTSRFHCAPRGCVFGCARPASGADLDDLKHYKTCPCLYRLLVSHLGPFPNDME